MRIHRFYLTTRVQGKKFDITDRDLVHQWRSVFRYNVGSQVIVFDGSGTDYLCMITSIRSLGASVEVIEELPGGNEPKRRVWLCLGLIKKDNFELVVEKATELGVSDIIPVMCDRSEKKNVNIERLKKISIEASEQSGRGTVPHIHDISDVQTLISREDLPKQKLLLNLDGYYIKDVASDENVEDLAIFIGPEGGWSDKEVKIFEESKITSVSLGSQVLRAETAAIASLSLILL